jgi:glycosyltransferase involved in cell wall biosynthesis
MNLSRYDIDLFPGSKVSENPKVSICLVTYNHEKYIEKCLDSILSQVTNFDFEIIIGEDHSTDQTSAIIRKYAENFPEKIKAFIRPKNIGSKLNFLHPFFYCKGEYIVHIEGDDYFSDPEKLQIQADFLDEHQTYSACFHNALMIYEEGLNNEDHFVNPSDQKTTIFTEDFLVEKETWFMATASVMMRKKYVSILPEWFLKSKSGDIPLYVILAEFAPIAYINRVMSVYRRHLEGLSFTDNTKSIDFLQNRVFMYSKINEYTRFRFKYLVNPILGEYFLMFLQTYQLKNKWFTKLYYFFKAYFLLPKFSSKLLKDSFKESLMTNFIKRIIKIYLIFR